MYVYFVTVYFTGPVILYVTNQGFSSCVFLQVTHSDCLKRECGHG